MVIASFLSLSPLYLWLSSSFYFYANFKKKLSHLPHHTIHPQLCTSLYLHLTLEIMLVLFFTGVSKTKYGKIKADSSEESCKICMF